MKPEPIVETILYVDPRRVAGQQSHDLLWSERAASLREYSQLWQPRAELQYETFMSEGYYHTLPAIFAGITLDVHAPIRERDIASFDEAKRRYALAEYYRTIDLAHALGARSLILHLTPHNIPWNGGWSQETRLQQLDIALDAYEQLVAYRNRHAPNLLLTPEGLEYPKWWSGTAEAMSLLPTLKEIDPTLTSCVDVAHLWHNRDLHPATITETDFARELHLHLTTLDAIAPVYKIHLAGAYIMHRDGGDADHQTHAIPGISPGEALQESSHLHLDHAPPGFRGQWMALDPLLSVIAAFARERGALPIITTEVHVREMAAKMQINAIIRSLLAGKLDE